MATEQITSNSDVIEWIQACSEIENCEIEAISNDVAFIESELIPTSVNTINSMKFRKNIPREFNSDGVSKLWVLISNKTLIVKRQVLINNVNINTKNANYDAGGRARISSITTLFDGKTLNQDDSLIWENVGTGSVSFIENTVKLIVAPNQYMIRRGRHIIPYFSGKSQEVETTFDTFANSNEVIKRSGYFSSNSIAPYDSEKDGFWLESDEVNNISIKIERIGVVKLDIPINQWDNYEYFKDYDFDLFTVIKWDYLWLGGTEVRMFIKIDGVFVLAHTYIHASKVISTFIKSPNQSVRYELRSIGASGTMTSICSYVGTEGAIPDDGKPMSIFNQLAIPAGVIGTIYALKGVKKTVVNRDISVAVQNISVINTSQNDSGIILLIVNPQLSAPLGYANKSKISEGTATTQTVVANTGRVIASFPAGTVGEGSNINNTILAQIGMSINDISDEIILAYLSTSVNQSVYGTMTIREY